MTDGIILFIPWPDQCKAIMTIFSKGGRHRYRIIFQGRVKTNSNSSLSEVANITLDSSSRFQHLDIPTKQVSSTTKQMDVTFPGLFTSFPPLQDDISSDTSQKQFETILECLPFLSGKKADLHYNKHGVVNLNRKRHISFLKKSLQKLPAGFTTADASRPWIFYWCLNGLVTMGEDVSCYREALLATIQNIQNDTGGFGGGQGQMSHLAPTYAIILALSIVGGGELLDVIDRKAMWKWLGALKQPNGGFQMAINGEEDVRGAYCAVVIIALLNLPIELPKELSLSFQDGATLLTGLPEWIARCQTFEGGISARPDAEAHGAYTFCALACLCILDEPHISIPRYLNVSLLVSWLSARQHAPEGGFSGRTNKLVDGCYSHWVGGCWPLIEACFDGLSSLNLNPDFGIDDRPYEPSTLGLYSREGLIRYILCCCQDQSKRGGLRDKPSHMSDAYHSCYVLAGLSSAQTKWHYNRTTKLENQVFNGIYRAPFFWKSEAYKFCGDDEKQIFDESDRLVALHPIFVIPEDAVQKTRFYYEFRESF